MNHLLLICDYLPNQADVCLMLLQSCNPGDAPSSSTTGKVDATKLREIHDAGWRLCPWHEPSCLSGIFTRGGGTHQAYISNERSWTSASILKIWRPAIRNCQVSQSARWVPIILIFVLSNSCSLLGAVHRSHRELEVGRRRG